MNSNASGGDDVRRRRDEEPNSPSDSENSIENQQPRRKRYHRHTPQQIQHMEAFFKECPHPDDAQRKELSRELGLEPLQIKFWFQNKRTQMKTQHEHEENARLRAENEKLRAENMKYKEALSNACCLNCRGPTPIPEAHFHEQQLVIENERLRQEIDQMSCITAKYLGKPVVNSTENPSSSSSRRLSEKCAADNARVTERAMEAAEELFRVAQLGEPLWVPCMDRNTCVLNEEEYLRSFSRVLGPKQSGFKSEATRESAVVPMDAATIVDILMNLEKWSNVFSGVVASAANLQVVSPGVGGSYNGATIVMCAEFQVPSPLVPSRESYFLRHAKHHVDGTWIVVDVSLHHLQSTPFRRRPSGCLIQDMPNAYSKITWVENVDVEEGGVHHIYKPLITAGIAFGAKRWIAILNGYCQRVLATNVASPPVAGTNYLENQDGKKSLMKLAESMVTMFCRGVNTSVSNPWTTLSANGNDNVKVMTRKNVDDPTMPFGIHLIIATSFWLPVPPRRVFDFLRDQNNRKEWEMLSSGAEFLEMAHIVTGEDVGNSIAIYQDVNCREGEMILLQESRTDPTASYVVYAPIGMVCLNAVLGGGDPSYVPLLPSGFAILPDGPTGGQGRGMAAQVDSGGSLLTVALQILVDSSPTARLSLGSVSMTSKLINCTVDNIKKAFVPNS